VRNLRFRLADNLRKDGLWHPRLTASVASLPVEALRPEGEVAHLDFAR
jgi:hypothetical protein